MKNIIIAIFFFQISLAQFAQIIADHTIVDKYDNIPQEYIDKVKKMLFIPAGESHSNGYLGGLSLLEQLDPKFSVDFGDGTGGPDPFTTTRLRAERVLWGDYDNATGWITMYGEEDWFTNSTALARTKAGLDYLHSNGWDVTAMGFVWCWDMIGAGTVGTDPVYGIKWRGISLNGPDGSKPWGLDADDYSITGNRVCLDTYLSATQEYIDYCVLKGYPTKIFFATGPNDPYGDSEERYQAYIKYEYIRNHVKKDPSRILFDYSDILCYDNDGTLTTETWNGHTFPKGTAINTLPEQIGHISNAGALRVGKALWWMLARIAGWDGITTGVKKNESSVKISVISDKNSNEIRINNVDAYISGRASLYNLYGELIDSKTISENYCTLSKSNLLPGVYIIMVSKSNLKETKKIIVIQ